MTVRTEVPFTWHCPYPSRRSPLFARNIVATSQPLAAMAGIQALQAGGNAADAALASAITLTVVEPTSNGIGSDAFVSRLGCGHCTRRRQRVGGTL